MNKDERRKLDAKLARNREILDGKRKRNRYENMIVPSLTASYKEPIAESTTESTTFTFVNPNKTKSDGSIDYGQFDGDPNYMYTDTK